MSLDDRARSPVDVPVSEMERLIALALGRGGSFADLYFERERTSSLLLEEGIIRTASAGVTCGLGVRVVSGERTGYAYTDDLSWPAMARAAETAAHIASDSRVLPPQAVSPAPVDRRYGPESLGGLALPDRIALLERADRAARAYRPAHREGDRHPRRGDASACASPTPRACSWRTCSRCSRSASR